MYKLNKKIADLKPYDPVEGTYKIRLDANESCFNFNSEIKAEIGKAIQAVDYNRYPDPNASDLCSAFANYYSISSSNVVAGNGSDELISVIMSAFLMKGEAMAVIEPDFSMYRFYSSIAEVNCIGIEKNPDLSVDINRVIETVNKENVKLIIFSNPCNPTSRGIESAEVIKLVSSVNALVVLDEAYMDFWENSLLQQVSNYSNLIILRTASKAVGAAALRLGFAVANTTIINAIKAVKSPYNVNTISQIIGTIIYNNVKYLYNVKNTIVSNRLELYNSLNSISLKYPARLQITQGTTNFIYIKTCEAKEIYNYLLQNSVAIRYMGEYIRISTGTKEENAELISLLNKYFS